jgi:hypothetical protein
MHALQEHPQGERPITLDLMGSIFEGTTVRGGALVQLCQKEQVQNANGR